MTTGIIVPVAKSVYLCDDTIGFPGGKTDLMGLFNSITPVNGYPHSQAFVVFAQLHGGFGKVPFNVDIRRGSIVGPLIYAINIHHLVFPHRDFVNQLAYTVPACIFPQADEYLVELYCDGIWVADVQLKLQ